MRLGVAILVLGVVARASLAFHPRYCRYWCKSKHDTSYHCCPSKTSGGDRPEEPLDKLGWPFAWFSLLGVGAHFYHRIHGASPTKKCPPLRPACSRFADYWYEAPNSCLTDEDCGGRASTAVLKCCFDACLDHKTCKPAE